MGYVGVHGVATLHRYKYSGVDHSYLAKYVLQPFWGRFVKFFPLWMPPNMITLTGFMFLVASALLGYIYSPRLDSSPPRWLHFAHGVLLFLYQTFDAVDGKQARHSSSPLGELFDHGCDALACAFEGLAFGSTTMCGKNTFWFWVISAIPFYGATWEHYFTNTLILPVVNGPTEGLVLIYFSHFFTTIVGTEWWAQHFGKSIPFLNWVPIISEIPTYGAALFFMIIFAVIPTVSFNVYNVYKVVHARKGSMLLAFAMLCPLCVLLGGVLLWDYLSPFNIMANYPHMVVLGTGLAFGFLVGRMILAHLCDEPKGLKTNMCVSLLYLLFGIANTLTARLNDGIPLVEEKWVLLGDCVYTVDSWRLMKLVCSDCEEQLVSSCSCSDISSRNSCSTIEVGSVGRISFLIENEKTDRTLNSRSKPDKGEKEKSDEVIVLKWSSSSCIELKRTKVFRRIGKLFRKKREKQSGGFDEKSDMCVSDYMGVGVSRTRSVCSFRASAFTDPDHESCEFAFSSAKISDVYEAEPRRSGFNRGVLDSENVGELKELDAGASIVPSACLFPVKEIDFSGMDGSGFIDLKIDLSSASKTEYSVLS